ncbi:MAG: hypothetical protein GWN99_12095 [Gemmatimonadetes bacterium]|uniref:Uncharacterized protein n=1 Tax=Candidatus Kutchimonas denitrificans TaxID=3056748 RepID=A0AAE4Z877_9BACT|nr:hypothetical protein [Gemmatimonadota bacterium]NIR75473.1 hypothetical protein [Candidatus Kutchimonas denitrificans]NIS01787.1 hypothetical protein [Gemmatimonadota bacterium]NIT67568.1 hypothetical protein [Gemmatimonadota bacterium]NIU53442.1 hypothetical protein [Gemmatimonadota bacterium]
MRSRDGLTRAAALALLLALPGTAGARLAIDSLAASANTARVETEHSGGCAWEHDHRVCLQAQHIPWAFSRSNSDPNPASARPLEPGPVRHFAPAQSLGFQGGARAPPPFL